MLKIFATASLGERKEIKIAHLWLSRISVLLIISTLVLGDSEKLY